MPNGFRALGLWLLLCCSLLSHVPGAVAATRRAQLSEQYGAIRAKPGVRMLNGLELLALGSLFSVNRPRHLLPITGPGQVASMGPAVGIGVGNAVSEGTLSSTYLGVDLTTLDSAEGTIRHNPATDQRVGTVMDTTSPTFLRFVACPTQPSFETALANFVDGDCLELTAGLRYRAPASDPAIQWPAGLTRWGGIRTANMSGLPARSSVAGGRRVVPSDASSMAIIETVSGNNALAIHVRGGRGWLWLSGIKCETSSTTPLCSLWMMLGNATVTSTAGMAHHVMVDRCLADFNPANQAVKKFVAAEAHYVAIEDSTIRRIFHGANDVDSHCVAQAQANGPMKLINSELNGASQSFLTGGANFQNEVTPSGERPARWEVRRCLLTKDLASKDVFYNPGGTGSFVYSVKVVWEFKDMQGAVVEATYMQNCWASGQIGAAVDLTNYSVQGQNERILDIAISYCRITDVATGFLILNANSLGQYHGRVAIAHTLTDRFNTGQTTGGGPWFKFTKYATSVPNALKYTVVHNTCYGPSATHAALVDSGSPSVKVFDDLTWEKNVLPAGPGAFAFGWWNPQASPGGGTSGLNQACVTYSYRWNVLVGTPTGAYPPDNTQGAIVTDTYTDGPNGNLALPTSPPSPYLNYGGAPSPGANVAEVLARTQFCASGSGWPT